MGEPAKIVARLQCGDSEVWNLQVSGGRHNLQTLSSTINQHLTNMINQNPNAASGLYIFFKSLILFGFIIESGKNTLLNTNTFYQKIVQINFNSIITMNVKK